MVNTLELLAYVEVDVLPSFDLHLAGDVLDLAEQIVLFSPEVLLTRTLLQTVLDVQVLLDETQQPFLFYVVGQVDT